MATTAANVVYLTGFDSFTRTMTPAPVFGVFSRGGTALVAPAGDVPAAIADSAAADRVLSYGRLAASFSTSAGPDVRRIEAILTSAAAGPADALADALGQLGVAEGAVGVDEGGLDHTRWRQLVERLGGVKVVAAAGALATARRAKAPYEIECLGRALHIAEEALDAVVQALGRGMTEREAAALYTAEVVKRDAAPRRALVATGERTWIPAAWPTDRALRVGDLVRLDVGCMYKGYCASVGRMAVLGEPQPAPEAAYGAIRDGVDAIGAAARPGTPAAHLYEAAVRAVTAGGIADHRPGHVGCGIGLEESEQPELAPGHAVPLEAGEVLAVEAAHYEIGSFGIAVRNTVLITSAGSRVLNRSRHDLIVLD